MRIILGTLTHVSMQRAATSCLEIDEAKVEFRV